MGGWNLLSGLMPPAVDTAGESERRHSRDSGAEEEFEILEQEEIKEHRHSEDSGNCSEAEEGQDTNRVLEFQLTQSLLSQVKAGENNRNANSGKQAQLDLERMDFVINGQTISKEYVCELYYQHNHLILNENYRTFAKQVFTEMFKHAKAEIPNDNVLEELITNCNQAGYEFAVYGHIHPILDQYGLIPTIPQKTVSLCCNSAGCIDVEYSDVIVVKNPDQLRQYEAFSKLEFTLKSRGDRAEYENGKVTLTIPKELENYKADGKSLLDDINRHFVDVGNTIIESLVENIDEGPKSFVVNLPAEVNSDSFDIIPENAVFDLGHVPELVKKAVDDKDVNALANHIGFFQARVTHVSPKEGLSVVEKILEIISDFVEGQGKVWNRYPTAPVVDLVYSAKQYYDGYISQADYEKVGNLKKNLCKIKSDLIKRSSNDHNEESRVKNVQDTLAMPNETQTSNQAVSREQLNNKESKNQQLRENVIDKGENIINSEKASKEAIGNNYRRGKMPKDIKTIGKKLSDAIFDLNYEEVRSLVEQVKEENNSVDAKQILNKALEDANKTEVGKKDKVSQSKLAEIKIFLEKELEHIAALPVSGDVGATASSQEVPVVERKESEPDSPSLSFEDDDFSKLEGDKSDGSAGTSSDSNSNSPFEEINEESHEIRIPVIETTESVATAIAPEMSSMVTEEKSDNLNDEKDDQQNFTIPTAVDQGTSPIPGSQCGTAHNDEDFTVPSQSSSLDFVNESLDTVISIDNNREEQASDQPAEHVGQMTNVAQPKRPIVIRLASNSNKSDTKENSVKWPTVATWMFAITGILAVAAAPAAYFALGTSLLVAGVAAGIGAFCIVAAIAIHYYNKSPSDSLAKPSIEEIAVSGGVVGAS